MLKRGIAWFKWLAILWLAANPSLRAAEPAATSSSNTTQTAFLEQQTFNFGLITVAFGVEKKSVPFKKEPDFQQRKVFRGELLLPRMRLPFIWDQKKGQLYLDRNYNGDLTDDVVYSISSRLANDKYQSFDVLLNFTNIGVRPLQATLHLNSYSSEPGGTFELKSFWAGKITLAGQEWQVGLFENMFAGTGSQPAYLLLRPWKARAEKFLLQNGSFEAFVFTPKLFFQNQAYQITYAFEPAAQPPRYKIEFKEQPAKVGELKITGKFVQRLILRAPGMTVVFDNPGSSVKVPVSTYSQYDLCLQQGDAKAVRNASSVNPILISETKTAELSAGGPLTNTVTTQRYRKQLILSYQLLGVNGDRYQLLRDGSTEQPQFAIYQGDKKIHSGKFEFG
jgi:hypothetical protein